MLWQFLPSCPSRAARIYLKNRNISTLSVVGFRSSFNSLKINRNEKSNERYLKKKKWDNEYFVCFRSFRTQKRSLDSLGMVFYGHLLTRVFGKSDHHRSQTYKLERSIKNVKEIAPWMTTDTQLHLYCVSPNEFRGISEAKIWSYFRFPQLMTYQILHSYTNLWNEE